MLRAQKAFQNVAETTDLENEYQVQAEIDKIRYNKDWWIEIFVDVIITGDKHFLELEIDKPDIVNPSSFLQRYK